MEARSLLQATLVSGRIKLRIHRREAVSDESMHKLLGHCLSFSWGGILFFRVSGMIIKFWFVRRKVIDINKLMFIVDAKLCCIESRPFSAEGPRRLEGTVSGHPI